MLTLNVNCLTTDDESLFFACAAQDLHHYNWSCFESKVLETEKRILNFLTSLSWELFAAVLESSLLLTGSIKLTGKVSWKQKQKATSSKSGPSGSRQRLFEFKVCVKQKR